MKQASAISPEIEQQARNLMIACHHPVSEILAGEYHSVFRGQGIEFDEVREYQPGDDVRNMEWKVTARTGHAYVKNYVEERQITVWLAVDVSGSLDFGTTGKTKRQLASEVCALVGLTAAFHHDRVGMVLFSDQIEFVAPPIQGRGYVRNLLEELIAVRASGQSTDITTALDFLARTQKKRQVVFLVSDFQALGFEDTLRIVQRHHDVIAIHTTDASELELPSAGLLRLRDAETGEVRIVDTSSKRIRSKFRQAAEERHDLLERTLEALHIDYERISTDDDVVDSLVKYFKKRRRKRRGV